MGIFVGDTEPSKIFVGGSEVASVWAGDTKVRPKQPPRTFTIVWQKASNPSQFFVRYEDDATGLTQGSTTFDDFFGYSAVRLASDGTETASVKQRAGNLDITQLGDLTTGDDVMIKFPVRGIKMSKSSGQVTLSITEETMKSGYQYYAHTRSTTLKDNLYLGAYKTSNNNQSLSGKTPTSSISQGNANTYASNKGTGWNEITRYARMYIAALYMMKYGNPQSQSVIGNGYMNLGRSTGITNSIQTATGATDTTSSGTIKLFGLEDWWGNNYEWTLGTSVGGRYQEEVSVSTLGSGGSYDVVTGNTVGGTVYGYSGNIQDIQANNKFMFLSSSGGASSTTYYCDYQGVRKGYQLLAGGAARSNSGRSMPTGVFSMQPENSGSTNSYTGCRLLYL